MAEIEKGLEALVYKAEQEFLTRQNPFCVISKEANENGWRDLQTNSAWSCNPYGEAFAVVPDEMVESIMETCGYCDIELNEDGTEVVSFTPTEIPVIEPEEEEEPEATPTSDAATWDDMAAAIEEGVNSI